MTDQTVRPCPSVRPSVRPQVVHWPDTGWAEEREGGNWGSGLEVTFGRTTLVRPSVRPTLTMAPPHSILGTLGRKVYPLFMPFPLLPGVRLSWRERRVARPRSCSLLRSPPGLKAWMATSSSHPRPPPPPASSSVQPSHYTVRSTSLHSTRGGREGGREAVLASPAVAVAVGTLLARPLPCPR